MAEELRLDIVSVAHSKGLTDAARDMKTLRGESDRLGDSFDRSGDDAFDFGTEITRTRARVKELNEEFRRTGDTDVLKDLKRNRSVLNDLERVSREAARLGPNSRSIFADFDASRTVAEARGQLILALVAAAVTVAPAVGAILAGAVAGTVAGGGIIGGVVAAAQDNRVKSAFKELVDEMTAESFGGGAFIQPTLEGIAVLKKAFQDLDLGEVFAKGASSVPILAQGIADLVSNIMPGFNEVMDQAETFTNVFAEGLGETGDALSDFLHSLMSSEGTIEGLNMGFKVLAATIIGLGNVLEFLANVFHKGVVAGAEFSGFMEDAVGRVPILGAAFRWMNDNFEDVEATGWGSAESMKHFTDMMKDAEKPTEDVAEALKKANTEFERSIDLQAAYKLDILDVEEGLQDLAETLAENGPTLDQFTDAGRDNQRELIGMAKEMRQVRDDQIAMGQSTESANATLAINKERLYALAEQAGISRAAVDLLVGSLFSVPSVVTTSIVVRTFNPNTGLEGRRAAGGPVGPGDWLVGENGPEILSMGRGQSGYVWPSTGGYRGSAGTTRVAIDLTLNGRALRSLLVDDALNRGTQQSTVAVAYP